MVTVLFILGGALAGYAYWRWHGCANGMCMIQTNKYMSITIGALMGFLVVTSGGCKPADNKPAQEQNSLQSASVLEDISAASFAEKMQQPDVIIVDVRTPDEFATGYLKGAVNINYNSSDFAAQLEKLDKSKTYLVYCKSGVRSGNAGKLMAEHGFNTVYTLQGGLNAWTGALEK